MSHPSALVFFAPCSKSSLLRRHMVLLLLPVSSTAWARVTVGAMLVSAMTPMLPVCELPFGTPSHGRASIHITHVTEARNKM